METYIDTLVKGNEVQLLKPGIKATKSGVVNITPSMISEISKNAEYTGWKPRIVLGHPVDSNGVPDSEPALGLMNVRLANDGTLWGKAVNWAVDNPAEALRGYYDISPAIAKHPIQGWTVIHIGALGKSRPSQPDLAFSEKIPGNPEWVEMSDSYYNLKDINDGGALTTVDNAFMVLSEIITNVIKPYIKGGVDMRRLILSPEANDGGAAAVAVETPPADGSVPADATPDATVVVATPVAPVPPVIGDTTAALADTDTIRLLSEAGRTNDVALKAIALELAEQRGEGLVILMAGIKASVEFKNAVTQLYKKLMTSPDTFALAEELRQTVLKLDADPDFAKPVFASDTAPPPDTKGAALLATAYKIQREQKVDFLEACQMACADDGKITVEPEKK